MSAEMKDHRAREMATQSDARRDPLRDPRAIVGRRISQEALKKLEELNLRFLKGVPNGWCVVMKDCDLSGLDLRSINLSHGHFIACNFENADLEDARFVGANLFSASFDGANLTRTNFSQADLRGACFQNAELSETHLEGADLRRGVVIRAGGVASRREHSTFRNAVMRGTNLSDCKLLDVDFEGAELSGVSLHGADLRGARFAGAELIKVEFTGANLSDADFRRAIMCEQTANCGELMRATKARRPPGPERMKRILDRHLVWIQTSQRQGERADFSHMDLSRHDFSHSILASALLRGAILADTNFQHAILAAADLRDAILLRADLTGADLRGADLRGASLRHATRDGVRTGAMVGLSLATRT